MSETLLVQIFLGIYLGILTGIIPALIAWILAFTFKYFTDVTVPALGVVVLGAALAGISGGLMGLLEPAIAETWVGIIALLVVLMMALWAHSKGDKMGASFPRRLTFRSIREKTLSMDVAERVGGFGQVRIRVAGEVENIEGFPPLSASLREKIREESWTYPGDLSLPVIESRIVDQLMSDYHIADVSVSVTSKGLATIAAAPAPGDLSRRVPAGMRAVSISTLIPTGVTTGELIAVTLPTREVNGTVVSVSAAGQKPPKSRDPPISTVEATDSTATPDTEPVPERTVPTATGGEGRITLAVAPRDVTDILSVDSAPITVLARGKRREYELISLLKHAGIRFRFVDVTTGGILDGVTLGDAQIRSSYDVAVLAIKRGKESMLSLGGSTRLTDGDELIVVGTTANLSRFVEAVR